METIFGTITNALTSAPLYDPFTFVTLAFSLLNVGLYVFDYVMDCLVVYWLSREDEIDSGSQKIILQSNKVVYFGWLTHSGQTKRIIVDKEKSTKKEIPTDTLQC